ncbi:TIGR02117 family protein [Pontibacter sp. G13]|uniref:TIGR02117 family protein n=1 Tax=Pontibacter sp. G13 TaxID=3074898 RepID=UPI00288A4AEA|nr:TIGR02117 family protein [Pontibacter sp. G13]WNJ20191.1 TIGR02117 family protein [Pontibacter sp. G13]
MKLRSLIRILVWVLFLPLILAFGYVLVACMLTWIPANGTFEEPTDGVRIYLISNGAHVDICVPMDHPQMDWAEYMPVPGWQYHRFGYVAFGWGERNFYLNTPTWNDLTLDVAAEALFLPSESAMHVSGWERAPRSSDRVRTVMISDEAYGYLVEYILASLKVESNAPVVIPDAHYHADRDAFLEATGNYHLLFTCNNWANRGLKEIGVKTATWAPFPQSVLYHLPR